jgi:uncharacterized protein YrrD
VKRKDDIIGRCIINIQTAEEVGRIKDVLLDPAIKGVAFYVLAEPSDYFGARLIDQKYVVGLGGFALTVTGEHIIEDVAHCPHAIELLKNDVQVIGSYALSDKGTLLGTVTQIFFDESTGRIVRYRIQDDANEILDIDGADILTLGGRYTIILEGCVMIKAESAEECAGHTEGDVRFIGEGENGFVDDRDDRDDRDCKDNKVGRDEKKADAAAEAVDGLADGIREQSGENSVRKSISVSPENLSPSDLPPRSLPEAGGSERKRETDTYGQGYAEAEDSQRYIEVSTRPLSTAEAALIKAAESMRKKTAAKTAKPIANGVFGEAIRSELDAELMRSVSEQYETHPPRSQEYARSHVPLKGDQPRLFPEPYESSLEDEKSKTGMDADRDTNMEMDNTKWNEWCNARKMNNIDKVNKLNTRDKEAAHGYAGGQSRENVRDAAVEVVEAAEAANAAETVAAVAGVAGSTESGKGKIRFAGAETAGLPESHNKKNLSASEIFYPKDFNLFDRRQMQFLLGKSVSQAVRLDSGDVMQEGEYISAEMLSRVRTRETLMKLTAHIRKT